MSRYKMKVKPKPRRSLVPLWLALTGLGLVLIAGWTLLRGSGPSKGNIEVSGAPRLAVEKDQIDHGDVRLGTPVIDTVRVKNVGDQPLQFTDAPYIEVLEGC